jgi:predicted metal-dependent HD superfamily phosphohydrolase
MLSESVIDRLRGRYAEPHRVYHTWSHIDALLRLLERHRDLVADPDAFEIAILFHDAIYDPHSDRNERDSAALMRQELGASVPASTVQRAAELILATERHALPATADADLRSDAALLLDMDLSILGAEPARFDEYDAAIRREYRHVPELAYRAGRTAVLRRFLERDQIYFTPRFASELEARARANLERALADLASMPSQE